MSYKEDTFMEYEYMVERFEEEHDRQPTQAEGVELWKEAEELANDKREARAEMLAESPEYLAWKERQQNG